MHLESSAAKNVWLNLSIGIAEKQLPGVIGKGVKGLHLGGGLSPCFNYQRGYRFRLSPLLFKAIKVTPTALSIYTGVDEDLKVPRQIPLHSRCAFTDDVIRLGAHRLKGSFSFF